MNHHQQIRSTTAAEQQEASAGGGGGEEYEDLMPLRAGFRLLADPARGAITAESLRRSAASVLGLGGGGGEMTVEEAAAMVREGDQDGDGALSEAEFCVLMVRLSPGIMGDAEGWLEEAIADELLRSLPPPPPA
ncbi:hypothetical protein DAI22_02g018300 [Oryza sativa Japonica Group]|nr:hypothetical protein DAI22_02g018300 [Oryza sativa Japonica Group]